MNKQKCQICGDGLVRDIMYLNYENKFEEVLQCRNCKTVFDDSRETLEYDLLDFNE